MRQHSNPNPGTISKKVPTFGNDHAQAKARADFDSTKTVEASTGPIIGIIA
jgi:hypothetical protein